MKTRLKVLLCVDIAVLIIIIFYKCYLFAFEKDFNALNLSGINKIHAKTVNNRFAFAVLGNIENSIDIFNNRIIPSINNDKDIGFVVSTGNAVRGGGEDKYRLLNKSLERLNVPAVAGIGENEIKENGAIRYYEHFGPFFFSFDAAGSYFIFLDTTGQTSGEWQKKWLADEMERASNYSHIFVFMNRMAYKPDQPDAGNKSYITDLEFSDFLTGMFARYKVDAVFSSGSSIYSYKEMDGVRYYTSGCAGNDLKLDDSSSFHHYLKVVVSEGGVTVQPVMQEGPYRLSRVRYLENIWINIHSFFYVNFANYLLVISLLLLAGISIHIKASKNVDYYRSFTDSVQSIPDNRKLTVAMFTNNYFPFIGGVPISISRLAEGLRLKGHTVYIFAPKYPENCPEDDPYVIRCALLNYHRSKIFNFAIVNIFSRKIKKRFAEHKFDIVHVHHPFWMGAKGLEMGKDFGIPTVLTYHTRFDSYYHYVPFMRLVFKNILSHHIVKRFAQKCSAVFAPTETSREYLSNIGVSRHIEVLPTGVDFKSFAGITDRCVNAVKNAYAPGGEVLLCTVSRLSREKNIFFIIEGMKYVKEHTLAPFKCVIIGDGPEKPEIISAIEKSDLKDTVILAGNVEPEAVCAYYLAADMFIFSSKTETQGMVLLEAMEGGCPVVAVSASGIEDTVVNGYNGFKTPDDVKMWSQKVIQIMENKLVRDEMSENARAYAMKFSAESMAGKAAEIYAKAMANYRAFNKKKR